VAVTSVSQRTAALLFGDQAHRDHRHDQHAEARGHVREEVLQAGAIFLPEAAAELKEHQAQAEKAQADHHVRDG
jgi:hypothetical protein